MTFTAEPQLRPAGPDTFVLLDGLYYQGRYDVFTVPAGFVTDFASVPRFATWLIPRFGRYTKAAIVHDWFCAIGIAAGAISSRDADGVFRRIMREAGVSWLQRWLVWTGVRWGALANPVRRPGWWNWTDTPRVLALSLLALPLLIIPTVAVLLGQVLFWLLDLVTGGGRNAGVTG